MYSLFFLTYLRSIKLGLYIWAQSHTLILNFDIKARNELYADILPNTNRQVICNKVELWLHSNLVCYIHMITCGMNQTLKIVFQTCQLWVAEPEPLHHEKEEQWGKICLRKESRMEAENCLLILNGLISERLSVRSYCCKDLCLKSCAAGKQEKKP